MAEKENRRFMPEQIHRITLDGTDVSFDCPADDTILRSALRAGIPFPYECNVGACGNCRFTLLDGELDMQWAEAPGWTDKDRERKRFLGCQATPGSACSIKLRTAPQYAPVHQPRRVGATLTTRRAITHDIVEFRFELDEVMPFEPGQYALLKLPCVAGLRAYSMSNIADGSRVLEFEVRRVPGGKGSSVLFDNLAPDTRIEIDGPYGMAYLRRDVQRDILCIAGGSGLAPMISIARGVAADPAMSGVKLHFLYGGRTPQDICGNDMLEVLPDYAARMQFHAAVSQADLDGKLAWDGHVGFVHDLAATRYGEQLKEMEIYFAGPPAMGTAVQRMLLALKVPFERVHFDQFY
jgi:toluene monooxygenase electron transfer component